jgi:hypothetical protein
MVQIVKKQILYTIWLSVLVFYMSDGLAFFIKLYRHYPYVYLKN